MDLTLQDVARTARVFADIWGRRYSDYTIRTVYEVLKKEGVTADELSTAVVEYLGSSPFAPSPCDLLRLIRPDNPRFQKKKETLPGRSDGLSKEEVRHEALRAKIIHQTGIRDAGRINQLVAIAERSFGQ